MMRTLNQEDRIEINKILESIEGRLDTNLIRLTMELILKTNWTKSMAINLFKHNISNIPDKSLNAFLLGSHFGQIYQISLNLAKKLELSLSSNQKNILREFVFFLVLLRSKK
jgi:acetoacetate decarboxylase